VTSEVEDRVLISWQAPYTGAIGVEILQYQI